MSAFLDSVNKFLVPGFDGPCPNIRTRAEKVKFLQAVIESYERLYPHRFRFILDEMRKMRECNLNSDGSYMSKNGTVFVRFRAPTEMWLYLQHRIPDWGKTEKDVELLCEVWQDLVRVGRKDRRKRSRLFVTKELADAAARG